MASASYFARFLNLRQIASSTSTGMLCAALVSKSGTGTFGLNDAMPDEKLTGGLVEPSSDSLLARKIVSKTDPTGLNLRIYQYQTCPFCSKVRSFLDYYGFSYEVVEVNPVTRRQIKFSSYRKVPILVAQGRDDKQLNDSVLITSMLASLVMDPRLSLEELEDNYPTMSVRDPKKEGKFKNDVANKYFLMVENADDAMIDRLSEERKWREWVDKDLVHTLSPNVYRTFSEALDSFEWFSKVGDWERLFPAWERVLVIYVGAAAMWLIGKKLKKRHNLKPDVRESLYDSCRRWVIAVGKKKFMGGDKPNLADLSVYGVLTSIEGCRAFNDLLANVRISRWFNAMREEVTTHGGAEQFSNHYAALHSSVKK